MSKNYVSRAVHNGLECCHILLTKAELEVPASLYFSNLEITATQTSADFEQNIKATIYTPPNGDVYMHCTCKTDNCHHSVKLLTYLLSITVSNAEEPKEKAKPKELPKPKQQPPYRRKPPGPSEVMVSSSFRERLVFEFKSANAWEKRGAAKHYSAIHDLAFQDEIATATVHLVSTFKVTLSVPSGEYLTRSCTCSSPKNCHHSLAVVGYIIDYCKTMPIDPSQKLPMSPEYDFIKSVESRSGKPLQEDGIRFLKWAWQMMQRGKHKVPQQDLYEALGTRSYFYGYKEVEILPKGGRAGWDSLVYMYWKMQAINLSMPQSIVPAFTKAELARVLGPIQRQEEVDSWAAKLNQASLSWSVTSEAPEEDSHEFRLVILPGGLRPELATNAEGPWSPADGKSISTALATLDADGYSGSRESRVVLELLRASSFKEKVIPWSTIPTDTLLPLIFNAAPRQRLIGQEGLPMLFQQRPLSYTLEEIKTDGVVDDYSLQFSDADGQPPEEFIHTITTSPITRYFIGGTKIYKVQGPMWDTQNVRGPWVIPAAALESEAGLTLMKSLGVKMPERIEKATVMVPAKITIRAQFLPGTARKKQPTLVASGIAIFQGLANDWVTTFPDKWQRRDQAWNKNASYFPPPSKKSTQTDKLLLPDAQGIEPVSRWMSAMPWAEAYNRHLGALECVVKGEGEFQDILRDWLRERPKGIVLELDPELGSILMGKVSGEFSLEVSETDIDWFDVRLKIDLSDIELTKEEIEALMKAPGKWVHLPEKGWRKLEMQMTAEQEQELADLGIAPSQLSSDPTRLHALQLASPKKNSLLPADQAADVRRRVEEIQIRVAPEVPSSIKASLRPYQVEGFHFLAFLTTNHFGGILADDMGLGKTLQTLTWLAWLKETHPTSQPSLVVCPKSVSDNWSSEAARFFPSLKVLLWQKETIGQLKFADGTSPDLIVANYAQMRFQADLLKEQPWQAVVLDEAQNIKNPSSQSSQIACALRATHRLALSGTPIENRLLDLWAIMAFAMPGILGNRTSFGKLYDSKTDGFARRRLSARVRPFLLRRTKKEVAQDLPDRTEEDLTCELEGHQAVLYRAELKRAQAHLLNLKTKSQLDKARFHILTSLLRLRQICCHPALVGSPGGADPKVKPAKKIAKKKAEPAAEETADSGSAKLNALLELLEPLMEEGHKVLVFSQFVQMLEIIQAELTKREWKTYKLTGQTDDRGDLVKAFQADEAAAVFLISLKAGGSGLNLTAASYVVLFDPWWNPAVEAQAIDRTHRIGQTQKVIAYRIITKGTIEQKIRQLQITKGAIAQDVLGEEAFAQALSLDDFQFLLADG